MYEIDAERLAAQAQRIHRQALDLIDDAEVLDENDVDTTTATSLGEKQAKLQDEMEKAIANFSVALERSDSVTRRPEYQPSGSDFSFTHDETAGEVTITYSGSVDLASEDYSVTLADSDASAFTGTIVSGDTATVDVSGAASEDVLEVSFTAAETSGKAQLPNASRAPVSKTNLPAHSLSVSEVSRSATFQLP